MADQENQSNTPLFDFEDSAPRKAKQGASSRPHSVDSKEGTIEQSSQYRSLNAVVGGIMVAIVAVSPIFVGSNRPIFWMFWTIALGIISLFYLIRTSRFHPQRPLRLRQFRLFFALYGAFLGFALLQVIPIPGIAASVSGMPDASLMGIMRMLGSVMFFALVLEVSGRTSRAHWMSWAIFYAIGLHALWALVSLNILNDIALWGEKETYLGVATGTFVNRNSFATFLAMGLALGLSLILEKDGEAQLRHSYKPNVMNQHSLRTYGRWLTMIVIIMALVATQSRAGYVSGLVGILVCITLMGKYVAPTKARVYAIFSVGVIAAAVIGVLATGLLDRAIYVENNADYRGELYAHVVAMIFESPILGHGTDTFWASFEHGHSLDLPSSRYWDLSHSSYLMLWFEYGLIIGSLPLIALGAIVFRLFHVINRRRGQRRAPIAAVAIIAIVAVHSLVDFSLEIQANVFLFLAIVAMGLGRYAPSDTDK